MIDIFSRYIVGAKVHPAESAVLAAEMMAETFGIHGTPQVVHADRGTSMTSKTVAALLSDLEVTCVAFPAPGQQRQPLLGGLVQNVEVRPSVPGTLRQPRRHSTVHGYFRRGLQPHPPPHRHTGIGLTTPADVHYGLAAGKATERAATLAKACARNPERFSTNLDPKILATPDAAWINNPTEAQEGTPKLAA